LHFEYTDGTPAFDHTVGQVTAGPVAPIAIAKSQFAGTKDIRWSVELDGEEIDNRLIDNAVVAWSDGEVKNFNYVYEAAECVTTGLKDLYHSRKDYSIHGLPVKLQVLGVKLLPHSIIMNIWLNQQKTARNNQGLTKNDPAGETRK
jgi:hypothetical protein